MLGKVTQHWGGHGFMWPQSLKELTPESSGMEGSYLVSPVLDCPVLLQGLTCRRDSEVREWFAVQLEKIAAA